MKIDRIFGGINVYCTFVISSSCKAKPFTPAVSAVCRSDGLGIEGTDCRNRNHHWSSKGQLWRMDSECSCDCAKYRHRTHSQLDNRFARNLCLTAASSRRLQRCG